MTGSKAGVSAAVGLLVLVLVVPAVLVLIVRVLRVLFQR